MTAENENKCIQMLASNQIVNIAFKKNENFLYHIRIILRMIIIIKYIYIYIYVIKIFLRTRTIDRFVDVNENFVAKIGIKIPKILKIESFNITNKIIISKNKILIFISEIIFKFS